MRAWTLIATVVLLPLMACSGAHDDSTSDPSALVLAEIESGPITAADLDRFILEDSQAFDPTADRSQELSSIVRRVAVNRLLLEEATLVGADQDPEFRQIERRLRHEIFSNDYLSVLPTAAAITEDQLRAHYQERLSEYQREEKRLVLHLYKRFDSNGSREATLAGLGDLRERLLAGETFEQIAREHSESETRFEGGVLGLIGRGQFTNDFDDVVFSLEERVPSEPTVSGDGAHIFLVREIFEARDFPFEEVAVTIRQELTNTRRTEALIEAAAALPQPENLFVPKPSELQQILRRGDAGTLVLRVGDFALTSGQFLDLFETERRLLGPKAKMDLGPRLLAETRSREVIYQFLRQQGIEATPPPEFFAARSRELIKFFAQRKMTTWVERQADQVQRHYDNNQMRFASPLKMHVELLSIPIGRTSPAVAAQIETATPELDTGRQTLANIAQRHDGSVEDLGFVSAGQIQAMVPQALRFLTTIERGHHTPPFTRNGSLRVFKLVERQDPRPRALALVRDQVVEDYLTHHAAEVFERLSDQLLEQAGYRLYEDRLEGVTLGPAKLSQTG